MLQRLIRLIAELFFTAAAIALLIAMALLVFGISLVKQTPPERKVKSLLHLAVTGLTTLESLRDRSSREVTKNA